MSEIKKVENPVYQDYAEILKQYDETLVVITDTVYEGDPSHFVGGVVRYYGNDRKKLINMWGDLKDSRKYGNCVFKTLFIDRGVHIHD
jgi:hypothetical protein